MSFNDRIKKEVEERLKTAIKRADNLSGGCINNAYRLITESGKKYLIKINDGAPSDMFEKEAHGLNELQKAAALRLPEVGIFSSDYLVTEYIESGKKSESFFRDFGRHFADLHKYKGTSFGFYEDNYIGSTPQKNLPEDKENKNWTEFYLNKRLLFQLELCEKNGYAAAELRDSFRKLENKIEDIIGGSEEEPSLLHGDLWSGNYMVDEKGNACIIDPAVYYGHREADLAMTKLFGGYPEEFYKSYNENYPLKEGWHYRENIYKLYHVLNHLNLFGMGYYSHALSLIRFYL
jgi:protein-ribulosamine 3-kinase